MHVNLAFLKIWAGTISAHASEIKCKNQPAAKMCFLTMAAAL